MFLLMVFSNIVPKKNVTWVITLKGKHFHCENVSLLVIFSFGAYWSQQRFR